MILLTGGSGKLGTELQKHIECIAPSSKELDITDDTFVTLGYTRPSADLIIHSAAYTNVKEAEHNKAKCYDLNVGGTINLLNAYEGIPFVFISSEYAFNPVNYYGETKLAAEIAIKSIDWPYLIIRTLFKPNPYPHEYAFVDQYTKGDTVNIIAKLIANEIQAWDRKTSKTVHVGTQRKTMYALALQTKPDVKPNSVDDVVDYIVPKDYR